MTTFASQVLSAMPHFYAHTLWPNPWDREDGTQDTIVKALTNAHRFTGGNLAAWLTTIMGNVRRDQWSKGYRKGSKEAGERLVYAGGPDDYARARVCLCDPEAILIALETVQ